MLLMNTYNWNQENKATWWGVHDEHDGDSNDNDGGDEYNGLVMAMINIVIAMEMVMMREKIM